MTIGSYKKRMRGTFYHYSALCGALILISFILCPLPANAQNTKGEIIWPYFQLRPWFNDEDGTVTGTGIDLQKHFVANMPEYDHTLVRMPPKRMFTEIKGGANMCVLGAIKTPERETYAAYSLPCRISLNTVVFIRRADLNRIEHGETISLTDLIARQDLSFGINNGVSYGSKIDSLLAEHAAHPGKLEMHGDKALQRIIRMILQGRLDWTIAPPNKFSPELAETVDQNLVLIPMSEFEDLGIAGHVICPDNAWGHAVIEKVDESIRQLAASGKLLEILKNAATHNLQDKFDLEYKRLILEPIAQD